MERERETESQQSSREWLKVHGLDAQRLTMDHLLPSLGFQQRKGRVPVLHTSVTSKYAEGLFLQHPNSRGEVFTLCAASPERLCAVEQRLLQSVAQLKARLQWLNSGSRLSFGVVYEKKVVLVIDSCVTEPVQLEPLVAIATTTLIEQVASTKEFNIIRTPGGVERWRGEGLVESTPESIREAIQWVEQTTPLATPTRTSVVEALSLALALEVEAVYLLTQGEASLVAYSQLLEKARGSPIPLHIVVFDCHSHSALSQYKKVASAASGRCHAYSPEQQSSWRPGSGQSQHSSSSGHTPRPTLPREDVLLVWAELERARDTLADIQAIQLEVGGASQPGHTPLNSDPSKDYADWLKSEEVEGRRKEEVERRRRKEEVERRRRKERRSKQLKATQQLPEKSREAWEREDQRKEQNSNVPKSSVKKPRTLMSSVKWLDKNSLAAKNLTLMDALGPSAIPHSPKHVPLLDKYVSSKVFRDIFPLAHISQDCRLTLINPVGVDLLGYERRLEQQMGVYWERLTRLAWGAVPQERREGVAQECGVAAGERPSYSEHRETLQRVMSELNWPRPCSDFDLLEREIGLAESYKRYSAALREEAGRRGERSWERVASEEGSEGSSSVLSSEGSLDALVSHLQLHSDTPEVPRSGRGRRRRREVKPLQTKGQQVIAQSSADGFFYPGTVVTPSGSRHALVRFADGQQQATPTKHILSSGGSGPCPTLSVGDHVLVRVRATTGGLHPTRDGSCDYFVPGEVRVLPSDPRRGHALHSIVAFNGSTVTCTRRAVVKITSLQYQQFCETVSNKMSAEEKQSHHSQEEQVASHVTATPEEIPSGTADEDHSTVVHTVAPSDEGTDEDIDAGSDRASGEPSPQLQSILDSQQSHSERLEKHQSAITTLQEQLVNLIEESTQPLVQKPEDDTDSPAAPQDSLPSPQAPPPDSPRAVSVSVQVSEQADASTTAGTVSRDQATSTGPWLEDKGLCTDPITESRGVGTDWSDWPSDSEEERDPVGTDEDLNVESAPCPSVTPPRGTSTPQPPGDHTAAPEVTLPRPVDPLVGQQVLARWPDDGWYYRGVVQQPSVDTQYVVGDASGDTETIHSSDIITDLQDSLLPLSLRDCVVGLHPDYPCSYAPGHIAAIASDGTHFTVEFYDGTQDILPRHEVYRLPQSKHEAVVQYLLEREKAWEGQAVIARRNTDGFYYPGKVLRHLALSRQYDIRWTDGSTQVQEVVHLFGPLTRRRALRTGDHVLAVADSAKGMCLPGEIHGVQGGKLMVQFCDGEITAVDGMCCFWLSEEYYQCAVAFICSTLEPSAESATPSEVTASYSD